MRPGRLTRPEGPVQGGLDRALRSLARVVLIACITVSAAAGAAAQAPPAQDPVQQLRQELLDQLKRLDALAARGTPVDAKEVASLKAILEQTRQRITALEAGAGEVSPDAQAQAAGPSAPSAAPAATLPESKPWMPDFYGSLRPRWGVSDTGNTQVGDRFSRVGLAGSYPITSRVTAVARIELGLNLAVQNAILSGNEHGYAVGQGSQAVVTRLGYGGFQTPYGTLTFGKQWGVYYDVAQWTDNFFTLGGDASGAYGVGDGGIPGTGRAETSAQYRIERDWFHLGLQIQERTRTASDKKFADTWGASLRFDLGPQWKIGAGYNEVLDGVPDPKPNEPRLDDRAAVAGAIWTRLPWTLAVTYDESHNHELDDLGQTFDARGWELFGQYDFNARWGLEFGVNSLQPRDDRAGAYRIRYYLLGVNYTFGKNMVLNAEYRYDESRRTDGARLRVPSVLILGMNWGWGK